MVYFMQACAAGIVVGGTGATPVWGDTTFPVFISSWFVIVVSLSKTEFSATFVGGVGVVGLFPLAKFPFSTYSSSL